MRRIRYLGARGCNCLLLVNSVPSTTQLRLPCVSVAVVCFHVFRDSDVEDRRRYIRQERLMRWSLSRC